MPRASREELHRLREDSNPLGVFVEDHLEVAGADVFTPTSEIAHRYRTFAAERNQKPIPDNQISPLIIEAFKAHSVRLDRGEDAGGKRVRGIKGVQLKAPSGRELGSEFDG